jgi:uncharacterized protein YwgA
MDVVEALRVARLILELGGVDGRTRLQKLVHLVQSKRHPDFKQSFILHHYGPFSRELAAQLDYLCAAGIVEETRDDDTAHYTYRIAGSEAKEYISRKPPSEPPAWADLAKALDEQSTDFLEAVSTLVYLHNQKLRDQELEKRFLEIKPHLKKKFGKARDYARDESFFSQANMS